MIAKYLNVTKMSPQILYAKVMAMHLKTPKMKPQNNM